MRKKKIDPSKNEELEGLEKQFVKEYGEKPFYEENFVGMHSFSAKIANSKIPVLFYGSSGTKAKITALKNAIDSMIDG